MEVGDGANVGNAIVGAMDWVGVAGTFGSTVVGLNICISLVCVAKTAAVDGGVDPSFMTPMPIKPKIKSPPTNNAMNTPKANGANLEAGAAVGVAIAVIGIAISPEPKHPRVVQ